jgi:hypothetical protein
LPAYAQTKQRPFPSPVVVLSVRLQRYYGRLRRPAGWPSPSRSPGYRTPRSDACPQPPGQRGPPQFPPSPSKRSAPSTPGGSWRLHVQGLHRFHGLRPEGRGSAPPPPASAGTFTARQASLDATDRLVAPPSQGLRRCASTPGVSPRRRQPATGPPGSYPDRTHTGWRRRACRWIRYASPPTFWAHSPVSVEVEVAVPHLSPAVW